MLSKPQFGWTDITIGDWTGRLSYIDDVPMILLNALREPTSRVHFNTEGGDIYIFFTEEMTYVVNDNEGTGEPDLYVENINRVENAYSLYVNIVNHIKEWSEWGQDSDEENPDKIAELLSNADSLYNSIFYKHKEE